MLYKSSAMTESQNQRRNKIYEEKTSIKFVAFLLTTVGRRHWHNLTDLTWFRRQVERDPSIRSQ